MKNGALCMALVMIAGAVAGQQPPRQPAKTMSGSLGLYVFPSANQNAETQQKDETVCYGWAKENTGFDPVAAASAQMQPNQQQRPKGALAKNAGGGAAAGAAIGAAAGDAGQGAAIGATSGLVLGKMAKRRAERKADQAEAQVENQQAAGMNNFRKAFGACMEGKGYTVK